MVQADQYFCDICSWRLLNRDSPLMLGGPEVVDRSHCVGTNESIKLTEGHAQRFYQSTFFPQCHRGHAPRSKVWVFRMWDTTQFPALGVGCIVPDCTSQKFLLILWHCLRSGTIVHSDRWAAYNRVQQRQPVSQHQTVSHSLNFVDPTTAVHTQNVESYWNRVKRKFKCMNHLHELMLTSCNDEFMWREGAWLECVHCSCQSCCDIILRYPHWRPQLLFLSK